jgi:AcrR family transcriptional regulator
LFGFNVETSMERSDRRIRRTQKSLHDALISLVLEKNYDSITIQEILDRADVGRATFYSHFKSKDELLISGAHNLRNTLNSAVQGKRSSSQSREVIIAFSRAMFEHASEYREVYHALLHTQGWPVFRQHLEGILDEIIRRECKAEIQKLRKTDSDVPVDLFILYLRAAFFSVLTWWLDRRSRLTPAQIDEVFRSLVLPTVHAVLG